jgi:hypothetical protein
MYTRICRCTSIVALFLPLVCVMISRCPAADSDTPWLKVENTDKYLFAGKTVWDIDAGKIVSPDGAPQILEYSRPIVGVSDRLFFPGVTPAIAGFGQIGCVYTLGVPGVKFPTLKDQPSSAASDAQNFWANVDERRVVWIQNGDYWRGDIDWNSVKIINRKQVTTQGAFQPSNKPLLWWGNLLYVYGNFDKDKPIVRINLTTNTVDELPTYSVFQTANSFTSPNSYRMFSVTPSIIYCFDARTGKATTIHNKCEEISGTGYMPSLFGQKPPIWTDDDTAYSFDSWGLIAKLDLRNSRMEIVSQPPANSQDQKRIQNIFSHFADVASFGAGTNPNNPVFKERYLVNVITGQHTTLPFTDRDFGIWFDDSHYIYQRQTGGLSSIGTWVYDRTANSNTHVFGGTIDLQRFVYFKKQNQIWSISQQGGVSLKRLNLDGSGSADMGACQLDYLARLPNTPPIDLGLTGNSDDLWKAPVIDQAALATTQPADPPQGKMLLLQQISSETPENQQFAQQAYDYLKSSAPLSDFYDPIKFAMKMLDAHKASPSDALSSLSTKTDLSDVIDRDSIVKYGHDQAAGAGANEPKLTADQKSQIADRTGQTLADSFVKSPGLGVGHINQLYAAAYHSARSSVLGQATAANNPPQQQANTQQNNTQPTQSSQQNDPQAKVDKAVTKAQKAKNTADQLRGLFGH